LISKETQENKGFIDLGKTISKYHFQGTIKASSQESKIQQGGRLSHYTILEI
jgi:hypothetical protein